MSKTVQEKGTEYPVPEKSGDDQDEAAVLSQLGAPPPPADLEAERREFEALKWTTINLQGRDHRVDTMRLTNKMSEAVKEFAEAEVEAQFVALAKLLKEEFKLTEELLHGEVELVYSILLSRNFALQKKTKSIVRLLFTSG